jgi:uncharacterized membrane protein YgdD (TMEM256/DUF423 family)
LSYSHGCKFDRQIAVFSEVAAEIPIYIRPRIVGDVSTSIDMTMVRIAAACCFLAVALGAFGAHWLRPTLEANGMTEVWNKAVLYHFIHAIALFVLALFGTANRGAWWLFFAGILIFSGSLYLMALSNVRWLGAVTPLGGLCFLSGWAWLVISPPNR